MGVNKGARFAAGDVFVDYPFEEVRFRWDCREGNIYRKFYGKQEDPNPVSHDNRLFNDALRFGDEIDRSEYERG